MQRITIKNDDTLRQRIIQLLIDNGEMMLSRIADGLHMTAQLAHYHLESLRNEGLVLSELRDRKRYYKVQDSFVKVNVEEIDEILRPLVDLIAENVNTCQASVDEARVLSNNVKEGLERYIAYLELVFENNHSEESEDDLNGF